MTEHEWLVSKDPAMMLRHLNVTYQPGVISEPGIRPEVRASDRKLRLLACEWYARVFPPNHPVLPVIESVRKWAEGEITREDAISAPGIGQDSRRLWYLFREIDSCFGGLKSLRLYPPHTKAEIADLLRDIVGNPYRPVAHPFLGRPHLLGETALTLARAAYEDRPGQKCNRCKGRRYIIRRVSDGGTGRETISNDCPDCHGKGYIEDGTLDPLTLAALADALEEAGCAGEKCSECNGAGGHSVDTGGSEPWGAPIDAWYVCDECGGERNLPHPILAHLRSPGPHVRGCWVIDFILGNV